MNLDTVPNLIPDNFEPRELKIFSIQFSENPAPTSERQSSWYCLKGVLHQPVPSRHFYFEVAQLVKNLSAHAGDARDMGLIHGLGRSLEKEMATHSRMYCLENS